MNIIKTVLSFFRGEKEISGDFSSFAYMCPVRDCGWYFQNEEDRQKHIQGRLHGKNINISSNTPSQDNLTNQ